MIKWLVQSKWNPFPPMFYSSPYIHPPLEEGGPHLPIVLQIIPDLNNWTGLQFNVTTPTTPTHMKRYVTLQNRCPSPLHPTSHSTPVVATTVTGVTHTSHTEVRFLSNNIGTCWQLTLAEDSYCTHYLTETEYPWTLNDVSGHLVSSPCIVASTSLLHVMVRNLHRYSTALNSIRVHCWCVCIRTS